MMLAEALSFPYPHNIRQYQFHAEQDYFYVILFFHLLNTDIAVDRDKYCNCRRNTLLKNCKRRITDKFSIKTDKRCIL